MNRYSTSVSNVANTINTEPVQVTNPASGATVRGAVYEFIISSGATPGDQTTRWALDRTTTVGSGGGLAEISLDPGSQTPVCQAASLASPSLVGSAFMQMSVNQRVTFRWVAAPNAALIFASGLGAGIAITVANPTGAYTCDFTMMWME